LNSDKSVFVLFDKSSQDKAQRRKQKDLAVGRSDVAAAWNLGEAQGAVANLLVCSSAGVPTLLLSGDDYVARTLATAGGVFDLFHDVGSALIQHEFPPSSEKITIRNPSIPWGINFPLLTEGLLLEDNDEFVFARANNVKATGEPHQLRRAYEWKDKEGWLITFTESLVLTIERGKAPKGL
jgi:hypothetical protein